MATITTAWEEFIAQDWTAFAKEVIAYFKKEYILAEKEAYRWGELNNQPVLRFSKRVSTREVKNMILEAEFWKLCHQYNAEKADPTVQKKARAQRILTAIRRHASLRFDEINKNPITPKGVQRLKTLKGLPLEDRRLVRRILAYARGS